jgi:hypothetical protein
MGEIKMSAKRKLTRDDILAMEAYEAKRPEVKSEILSKKRNRRQDLGPDCTFYFENYDTMWLQVHEMLYIERGGEKQIADELAAYNPLIPSGKELVATVMFEIDEPQRRRKFLAGLGGIEETAFIEVGGETVIGVPEQDVDRTTAAGKASSVQFIHFPFDDRQIAAFRDPDARVVLGFTHPAYAHMVVFSEAVRQELAGDFD